MLCKIAFMSCFVCTVPVAPMRIEPNHRSEMMSQLLFGECGTIVDSSVKGWVKIVCKLDNYTGWCQLAHVQEIDTALYNENIPAITADWINELDFDEQPMMLPFGSSLPAIKNDKIQWGNSMGMYKGAIWKPAKAKRDAATIEQIAFTFLNTPYLWGGRSVFGIDCSGLVQLVYKFLNYPLLRDAQQQVTQGTLVNFLQEARCGDLAFFDDETGAVIHVGILLNEHEIIHAAGKVRIDKIDNQGITNVNTGERTHQLRIIKRYF
jgi:gamma-D-glutamyl-L-lysine dipeptidyl-peptidase